MTIPLYPILAIDAARAYEASVLQGDQRRTAAAMENAGRAIGAALLDDFCELRGWPAAPRVLLLAGKGLNTGDALVACETLHAAVPGLEVTVVTTAPAGEFNPLAAAALGRLRAALGDRLRIVAAGDYISCHSGPADVVLDGVHGHGFRPPLREPAAALLRHVNAGNGHALRAAIDLPSGLGEGADPDAFVADITYIPGVAKEPCFEKRNAGLVGRLRFLEVEPFLNQPVPEGQRALVAPPNAYKALNRLRPAQSDKRHYGHCLIMGGSPQMPGALLMAAMGALQAGAGLVTALVPESLRSQLAGTLPEAMWRQLPQSPDGALDAECVRVVHQLAPKAQALLIGPGMLLDRTTVYNLCRIIRETPLPLVVDASALTQDIIGAVVGRPLSAGPAIVTPHPGEYARMHGIKEEKPDPASLLNFSAKYRAITVLKGSPTIIADGQRLIHIPAGGPVLARGGSGDILAGMLTALLARDPADPVGAAIAATTWHGAAGDALARERGAVAVRTTELLDHLAPVLRG